MGDQVIRANALRTIRGGQRVVAFQTPDGGWYAVPESVVGRDDTAIQTRNAEIIRAYPGRSSRRKSTYFLIGVPRYVKALRVLVSLSFPVENDDPVPLACPRWISANQDLGSGEEVPVCMPIPDLGGGDYTSFSDCRTNKTYPCPRPDPPSPDSNGRDPSEGRDPGAPEYPPQVHRVLSSLTSSNYSRWGSAGHGTKAYVLRTPGGGISVLARVTGSYETQEGRVITRRFGTYLATEGGTAVISGDSAIRKFLEKSEILRELPIFNMTDLYRSRFGVKPKCGRSLTSDFPLYSVEYENVTTYNQTTGDKVGTTGTVIGITADNDLTRITTGGTDPRWYKSSDFPGCPEDPPSGGGGDDDPPGGLGGGGGGGGDSGGDPPEPDPPRCYREEGNPDNISRKFYIGKVDQIGEPEKQIEISDADEYRSYIEAKKDGWTFKLKYGANGKLVAEGEELEPGTKPRKYCKVKSFGSGGKGWQDPISTNLNVYTPKNIEDLEADPWVKESAGLDVNFVWEEDRLFRFTVDRGQQISAANSLSNVAKTLEQELKLIIPNSGPKKDPIPVVIKKEEINVDQSRTDRTTVIVLNSETTIAGAVYRVAYRDLFPEDAITSIGGCPVGEFEIEQLSPIKVDP